MEVGGGTGRAFSRLPSSQTLLLHSVLQVHCSRKVQLRAVLPAARWLTDARRGERSTQPRRRYSRPPVTASSRRGERPHSESGESAAVGRVPSRRRRRRHDSSSSCVPAPGRTVRDSGPVAALSRPPPPHRCRGPRSRTGRRRGRERAGTAPLSSRVSCAGIIWLEHDGSARLIAFITWRPTKTTTTCLVRYRLSHHRRRFDSTACLRIDVVTRSD